LYVKGQPQYHLEKNGRDIGSGRGASGTWHFIIDLEPGSEVILTKHHDKGNNIDGKVALHMIGHPIMARDEEFPIIQVRDPVSCYDDDIERGTFFRDDERDERSNENDGIRSCERW